MNLKKAKLLRKLLKANENYINASDVGVVDYKSKNIQTLNVPGSDKTITISTRYAPANSKRGMYLAAKRKLA